MVTKESFVLILVLSISAFAVAAHGMDESRASTDTILLVFEGGDVRQSDFNAFIDYKTVFYNNGDRRSPQYLLYNNKKAQEEVLHRIAFNKIVKAIIEQNKLDERDHFELKLRNDSFQAAWQYFMLTQMYPVIKEVRKPWEEKWTEYYKEHADDFREPSEVSYRMIFLNTMGLDEEAKQQKYALAEKLRKELEKDPKAFIQLAKQYSEVGESIRGVLIGPLQVEKIDQRLAAALKGLDVGQISPVVHCGNGAYILLLEILKKGTLKPFPEVRRFVVANVGEFYVYDIVRDFKKELIGDAKPVYLHDNISTATADLDKVIAYLGEAVITNREVEYLLPMLYDARFNAPGEIEPVLSPIVEKKAIFESAQLIGYFNSERFVNYMNAYIEDQYAERFIRLYYKKEVPKEFLNLGEGDDLMKNLVSRYTPRLIQYPEIPPIE
jgi:parvulin-like peptidyl-prolyl isomerase